jgi:hypothetical protein
MRDKDSIFLESVYDLICEDAESSKRQCSNMFIHKKDPELFKYKNKPENQKKLKNLKADADFYVDGLEKIVKQYNPRDKNLSDMIPLMKFLLTSRIATLDSIQEVYPQYMQYPALVNQKIIHKVKDYTEFTAKIHEEDSKKNKSELIATLGGDDDPNRVYEDDKVIVFRATDTEDPMRSLDNCKKYGKGSRLCISSGSDKNIFDHYFDYRLDDELTTYFVWVKEEGAYLLVDAQSDGRFSWNPNTMGGDNSDYDDFTMAELIEEFPYLKGALEKGVIKSLPISDKEKNVIGEKLKSELENIKKEYEGQLNHFKVNYQVNEINHTYKAWAYVDIALGDLVLKHKIPTVDNISMQYINSGYGVDKFGQDVIDNKKRVIELMELFGEYFPKDENQGKYETIWQDISGLDMDDKNNSVRLFFKANIRFKDDARYFELFINSDYHGLLIYDKIYDEIRKAFIRALGECGYIDEPVSEQVSFKKYFFNKF